ncbi:MAG: 2Fe-2S iron-sulfur cluster-binding protein, partial [Ruthenibacterium sp.]
MQIRRYQQRLRRERQQMDTVKIKIDGTEYEVAAGSTILEAAHSVGIDIPT